MPARKISWGKNAIIGLIPAAAGAALTYYIASQYPEGSTEQTVAAVVGFFGSVALAGATSYWLNARARKTR